MKPSKPGPSPSRPALRALIADAKRAGGAVHLMGLISPGGVHSHQNHIAALAGILDAAGLDVRVHAFLDGRDTPPQSALGFVTDFERSIAKLARVGIATVSGRYYAMDRDQRWERVAKAYSAIVEAEAARFTDAKSAIAKSYQDGVTDEFVRALRDRRLCRRARRGCPAVRQFPSRPRARNFHRAARSRVSTASRVRACRSSRRRPA